LDNSEAHSGLFGLLPLSFVRFFGFIEILITFDPKSIAIVGSYGDFEKTPNQFSDLDLVFVFDTESILSILNNYMRKLSDLQGIEITYLGVTFQFGHTISMYFHDDPLHWIDIGIMDCNYANNYLVDLPLTAIKGIVSTCGISSSPQSQLHHLAKKILKAQRMDNSQLLIIFCYRYLGWWKTCFDTLYRKISKHSNEHKIDKNDIAYFLDMSSEIREYFGNYDGTLKEMDIIHMVMKDIEKRFPVIFHNRFSSASGH
jgi:hypothetical protein